MISIIDSSLTQYLLRHRHRPRRYARLDLEGLSRRSCTGWGADLLRYSSALLLGARPRVVIELGTWKGASVLRHARHRSGARIGDVVHLHRYVARLERTLAERGGSRASRTRGRPSDPLPAVHRERRRQRCRLRTSSVYHSPPWQQRARSRSSESSRMQSTSTQGIRRRRSTGPTGLLIRAPASWRRPLRRRLPPALAWSGSRCGPLLQEGATRALSRRGQEVARAPLAEACFG